mmetsp:Transcript_20093/g.30090  ORF Transcript_20093/g.30090 Transcript_20093/m.30090 type:complete len:107 (+) Transcript_20093:169-489(+)
MVTQTYRHNRTRVKVKRLWAFDSRRTPSVRIRRVKNKRKTLRAVTTNPSIYFTQIDPLPKIKQQNKTNPHLKFGEETSQKEDAKLMEAIEFTDTCLYADIRGCSIS